MSMETNTTTNTYQSTCRYCGTTVTWSEEANIPTDAIGMICCDGCYNEATGYGAYPEEDGESVESVATNYGNEVTVGSCLAAAQIAGQLAGRTGGIWTTNKACTTYIVARSTHPSDMRKDARYLTIRVAKSL